MAAHQSKQKQEGPIIDLYQSFVTLGVSVGANYLLKQKKLQLADASFREQINKQINE